MQVITLDAIMAGIREKVSADYDLVIAIERGGVLPGCLAARWLNIPLFLLSISFRDDNNRPCTSVPVLIRGLECPVKGRRILLADDVSNSGATLKRAREELAGASVTTLVISGSADISLFGPHTECIFWPWSREQ
ncbi:MAG: hypothetical protein B0D92_03975 [Spirochaeta sp. LUC14_002_19_P3]|nr:MAG: hypothetical protein B0D92_03975 [Spirochaeta sp. LUC14_002_19_P3]